MFSLAHKSNAAKSEYFLLRSGNELCATFEIPPDSQFDLHKLFLSLELLIFETLFVFALLVSLILLVVGVLVARVALTVVLGLDLAGEWLADVTPGRMLPASRQRSSAIGTNTPHNRHANKSN